MALSDKWWICAVSLLCVARFGSCHRHDGRPNERFIFNEVCALKEDQGPCKGIKERFFFSVLTGKCEMFEYGGCGGNSNNFGSLKECEDTCVVSDDKNPCHLPEAPGPCRGLVTRYFFDSESQQCKHFYYGGCFGNANNFRRMEACQAKCQSPVKPSEAPMVIKSDAVQPAIVTGELGVHEPQVQLNSANQDTNVREVDKVCLQPMEAATCDGGTVEKRFAYNPQTRRCHSFYYRGCGGNENNFQSRKECFRKCIKRRQGRGFTIPVKKKFWSKIPFSKPRAQD
ncbi:tissue factor pathway inhibitor a isoform X2 [Anabas testudineus]|uniref:tissue factor pathway inhibitor a isoform X2 n=1 Tax=Anabas testudineus TaxID=64144 RepID=UPI000E45E1D3|nr:tissue factor pathway inhibitor a isoform X2 [Anabas testudineus]